MSEGELSYWSRRFLRWNLGTCLSICGFEMPIAFLAINATLSLLNWFSSLRVSFGFS